MDNQITLLNQLTTGPAITSIGYDIEGEVQIQHTVPIRGGFAELQKKGLRIKDYRTTEKQ